MIPIMRRPVNPPAPITGDRASHAAYGVGPATDYGVPVGTPVLAPFAGRVSKYTTSEGGLGIVVAGADATFYGQHLWVRLADGQYAEGDRIALSGNTGTLTTGPHLHCYVIVHATGERLSMEEYLARTAGDSSRPFTPESTKRRENPTMYLRPTEGTTMVRKNNTYADDGPGGSWRGLTNLESVFVEAEIAAGRAAAHAINGVDMEIMFALRGVAEQPEVTPLGFQGGAKKLSGLGAPTGRIKFPGTAGFRGQWHYPPVSNR